MPQCVLKEKCLFPRLSLREGHKCPKCLGLVHVLCGVEDPECTDLHLNVTCNACAAGPVLVVPLQEAEMTTQVELQKNELPKDMMKDMMIDTRMEEKKKAKYTRKDSPKKKASKANKKHPQAAELIPTKLKKSVAAQSFRLSAVTGKQDPLIMKSVCFLTDDGAYGQQLAEHFGGVGKIEKSLCSIDGNFYLFGNVVRASKLPKKGNANVVAYDVQWEDLVLGETKIDLQVVVPAIELSVGMRRRQKKLIGRKKGVSRKKYRPEKLFEDDLVKSLFVVHEGEDGDPMDSDTSDDGKEEDENKEDPDDDDLFVTTEAKQKEGSQVAEDEPAYLDEAELEAISQALCDDTSDDTNTGDDSDRFRWRAGQHIDPPRGKSNRQPSVVKPESVGCFLSPLSSFLAFVPLKLLKSMVYFSNMYADSVMAKTGSKRISGARWHGDISIAEMMAFFGILIKMVLRPTPGQSYASAWKQPEWHPYTRSMTLRRFQQIRAVFHANDNTKMAGSNDSLFKVRPVLNCLKLTFPSYLDVGDELALDEASVSSRSKFGGFSIFFNPTKPGGKFHFRFYLLCCSSSYACVRIRMHTRDMCDTADGYQAPTARVHPYTKSATTTPAGPKTTGLDPDDQEGRSDSETLSETEQAVEEVPRTKLVTLVLDMCSSLYDTGRVVNMDNYYTSPEVAVALAERRVYIRGTCRANRGGFPPAVQYSRMEAAKVDRGTHKMVSDKKHGIACYGWIDGNPVHFLTTADGTVANEVTRRIGRQERKVQAPICIKRYNKGMQAVDRHDQLRQTFSLASRHGFKKYYVKIILGLVDMALVNAYIHYKLVNKKVCKKDTARYDFMESLANALITTDWENFANSERGISNDSIFQALLQKDQPFRKGHPSVSRKEPKQEQQVAEHESETTDRACVPYSVGEFMNNRNQKNGFACQVCRFEERGKRLMSVVICTKHCLRLCTKSHERKAIYKKDGKEISDYSWMAPNDDMSCWEKAHSFYIQRGLFKKASANEVNQDWNSSIKLKFVNAAVSSDCYTAKRRAFGLEPMKRGGNSNQKTPKWNGSPGSQVPVLDSDGSADDELAHVLESGSVVDFDSDEE
jgi:hypothetical protein